MIADPRRPLLVAAASLALAGCGAGPDTYVVGTRQIGSMTVIIDSRPSPPRAGHNELVVSVTEGDLHRPVYDAKVDVRALAGAPWIQAIEDGHVGVYRRAVDFGPGGETLIDVDIDRQGHHDEISLPIHVTPTPP